jgi:hypothetical protein
MYKRAHPTEISDPVDLVTYLRDANIVVTKQPTEVMTMLHNKKKDTQGEDQL